MKKIKLFFIIIVAIYNNISLAGNAYPKSAPEQKWDEIGSMANDGEGIVFRPGKIKNKSTKASGCSINKYLWQASIEIINFVPLTSVDSNGGVIITEWYTPKNQKNYRFKINIFIKDEIISPDAIEVKVFEEIWKNNHWVPSDNVSNIALILEDKILRKARSLYINSKDNK